MALVGLLYLRLVLVALAALLPNVPVYPLLAVPALPTTPPTTLSSTVAPPLVPLPRTCIAGLPVGAGIPVCCMFGYVLIDGQAVAGAKIIITSPHGRSELWTERGPDSPLPYYRVSLSDPPLSAQINETISIAVEYSRSHRRTITHTVLGGGQHVDIVLPRNQSQDIVFLREILPQMEAGQFYHPTGIATDGIGTVYVVDSGNARVQAFTRSGQFLHQWGTRGNQPGQFIDPTGIALDLQGNIYVVDTGNSRIQKFSSTGTWLASWGSFGANDGQLYAPHGIAIDGSGNVYVAEQVVDRVQKFSSTGTRLATWSSTGGNAQFDEPQGLAVDSSGNVYVTDSYNEFRNSAAPGPC